MSQRQREPHRLPFHARCSRFAVSSIELSLRPVVSVEIAALGAEASIAATLWARADAAFQYPAFNALPGFYQSPTTSRPALMHAGSCTTPHLLRYAVTAGVRDIEASAKIDFNLGTALGVGLLSSYVVKAQYSGQVTAPEPYSLVTGCLIRATQDQTVTATITLTTVRDPQQQTNIREHEGHSVAIRMRALCRELICACVFVLRFALSLRICVPCRRRLCTRSPSTCCLTCRLRCL